MMSILFDCSTPVYPAACVAATGHASSGEIGGYTPFRATQKRVKMTHSCWLGSGSKMFLQLGHELSNWMVEVAGFNQPSEFPAQDFIKRQRPFQHVIQVLTINSDHGRGTKAIVSSDTVCREATCSYEDATTDLGVTGNAGIEHC
jgi:hypothetical protein